MDVTSIARTALGPAHYTTSLVVGRLRAVQDALGALARLPSPARILDEVPRAICGGSGFHRAEVYRAVYGKLVAVSAHARGDRAGANHFLQVAQAAPPPIATLRHERIALRSGRPLLVGDPRHIRLAREAGTPGYVLAPI